MSDQPNRDHRCRTCEHWAAPICPEEQGDGKWPCDCPVPFFVPEGKTYSENDVSPEDGEECHAYSYSYRRARLEEVKS